LADELAGRIPAAGARDWLDGLFEVYALAAATARADDRLSADERAQRVVGYAERAAAAVVSRAKKLLPADEWRKYRDGLAGREAFQPLLGSAAVRDALKD
jgi:hypothetical protein